LGESDKSGIMGRIVPNYSAFEKRNDFRVAFSSSRNAVSFSFACTTNRFPSSQCASAIQTDPPRDPLFDKEPQRASRALGTQLKAGFASRTQMNVRRPLIVKKRESGYESVELNRRAAATDSRRPPDPTSRMDRAKWRMPSNVTFTRHA
jgi:hypothetical protein